MPTFSNCFADKICWVRPRKSKCNPNAKVEPNLCSWRQARLGTASRDSRMLSAPQALTAPARTSSRPRSSSQRWVHVTSSSICPTASRRCSRTTPSTKRWSYPWSGTVATAVETLPRTSSARASRKQRFRASTSSVSSANAIKTTDEQKQVKSERRKIKISYSSIKLNALSKIS